MPRLPTTIVLASLFLAAGSASRAEDAKPVDFAREILPILSNKCFVCHGPDTHDADMLRLDSHAGATADRDGQKAVDPDDPTKSLVLARINDREDPMPPADAEKPLTAAERSLLERWIRSGGEYTEHWSFVPPVKALPAKSAEPNPIDAFVAAGLRDASVDFAPESDRATLARRLALVLTGLLPEPDRLDAFLADERPDAYERFVDELLDSPRFGEHQARYWLDAVRYGDTHGLHLDNRRGIYPYRDWVVRAFNQNLPLDDFLVWQLAGDLLPDPTLEQRVATGFVRLNPSTGEGGAIPAEFQVKNNFDRVETLGTMLLGMSLTCARCHTHKYDPVTQTEYYRLLAFFNSTAEPPLDGNRYEYGPTIEAPADQAAWENWESILKARDDLLAELTKRLEGDESDAAKKWRAANATNRLQQLVDPKGPFAELGFRERARELRDRFTTTLVARDLPKPRPTHRLDRGEYDRPVGNPLEPGVPAVLGGLSDDAPPNRLGLARWVVSKENPLVARVLVNRIWARVFGIGLVRTPEEFGLQGSQPTHPKLLDWLAVELHDSEWNAKRMLRLMVTSRAFRQSSARRDEPSDPENLLWARGPSHRLDAEVIRDVALLASGLLDPHMGGEGVKPYQPGGLWKALAHPASNTKQYVRDLGPRLYRRSLYVYWKRTSPHPMMMLFDAPDRESSCVRRSRTSTALQSLALLNETQRVEVSRKLAERLIREAKTDDDRLDRLFRLFACRPPKKPERTACLALLERMRARYADSEADALALLAVGDAPRDETLPPREVAAWSQLATTVLASDLALLLY